MGKNAYSVLELPLVTEKWQRDILDTKLECVRKVYNRMLDAKLKKYHEMIKTKEWRELNDIIREELTIAGSDKKKTDRLKAAYERKNTILKENGFSEFGFRGDAIKYSKYYQKHISSVMASCGIGEPMWRAFEKLLYGNGNAVHFKKINTVYSLVSDNKSGIRLIEKDGRYIIRLSNKTVGAKKLELLIKGPNTEYDTIMLESPVKMVRIVKKMEKGHRRFYCQLTVAREPFFKLDNNGNLKHPIGTGTVGICVWRNILCAVGDNKILEANLIPDEEEYLKKREKLSRELEHLRRVNNPYNFNEEGTIKKSIINEEGKKIRLQWYESNHYKKVKHNLKELYRVHNVKKKLLHNKVILELLNMGNKFYFLNSSFNNMKPEWDEDNPLPNFEYKKKKQRRRAIQEVAPSSLFAKLDNKLAARGLEAVKRIDIPEEMYWYRHDIGVSNKDFLKDATVVVCNTTISQTMYRAFLIKYYNEETKKYSENINWKSFVKLPKIEIGI